MSSLKHAPDEVLRTYVHAKDENRPHLMQAAFCDDAVLRMHLRTDNITFPAESLGREAITCSLVRNFGQQYENVYTFYLDRPAHGVAHFSCDWLVGMSDKSSGHVRVGCGRYDWEFDRSEAGQGRARHLGITIHAMQILPPEQLRSVMQWLGSVSYPWTSAKALVAGAPDLEALMPVLRYIDPWE